MAIQLPRVATGYFSTAKLNQALDALETHINEKLVHRSDGLTTMNQPLDLNGYEVINVNTGDSPTSLVNKDYVDQVLPSMEATAVHAANRAEDAAESAATSADTAANIANNLSDLEQSAENSATAAANSASEAQDWATAEHNVLVENGKYSAKHWAVESENSASEAQDWATADYNVVVEDGKYSAKHWAIAAHNVVTQGVIDDSAVATTTTWSSEKISDELSTLKALALSGL